METTKFYAVIVGRIPGIYESWKECQKQVIGFKNATYKSFNNKEDAEEYFKNSLTTYEDKQETSDKAFAYIDGSFNAETNVYGYGGVLVYKNEDESHELEICGSESNEDYVKMRNVAGEIKSAMMMIEAAIGLGLDELTIYYDYIGIEMWAKGLWNRNNKLTKEYYDFINSNKDKIKLTFVKVKSHTGVKYNERVDELAKMSCGLIDDATINNDTDEESN